MRFITTAFTLIWILKQSQAEIHFPSGKHTVQFHRREHFKRTYGHASTFGKSDCADGEGQGQKGGSGGWKGEKSLWGGKSKGESGWSSSSDNDRSESSGGYKYKDKDKSNSESEFWGYGGSDTDQEHSNHEQNQSSNASGSSYGGSSSGSSSSNTESSYFGGDHESTGLDEYGPQIPSKESNVPKGSDSSSSSYGSHHVSEDDNSQSPGGLEIPTVEIGSANSTQSSESVIVGGQTSGSSGWTVEGDLQQGSKTEGSFSNKNTSNGHSGSSGSLEEVAEHQESSSSSHIEEEEEEDCDEEGNAIVPPSNDSDNSSQHESGGKSHPSDDGQGPLSNGPDRACQWSESEQAMVEDCGAMETMPTIVPNHPSATVPAPPVPSTAGQTGSRPPGTGSGFSDQGRSDASSEEEVNVPAEEEKGSETTEIADTYETAASQTATAIDEPPSKSEAANQNIDESFAGFQSITPTGEYDMVTATSSMSYASDLPSQQDKKDSGTVETDSVHFDDASETDILTSASDGQDAFSGAQTMTGQLSLASSIILACYFLI